MSSYSLLQAFSGIRYSAVDRTLHLRPTGPTAIQSFLSTATAYDTVRLDPKFLTITLLDGSLPINNIKLTQGTKVSTFAANTTATATKTLKLFLQNQPRSFKLAAIRRRGRRPSR